MRAEPGTGPGHITEETWPEARAVLDAFRVGHRAETDRYAGHMKGYNVWIKTEDLTGEPWWEELVEANREGVSSGDFANGINHAMTPAPRNSFVYFVCMVYCLSDVRGGAR